EKSLLREIADGDDRDPVTSAIFGRSGHTKSKLPSTSSEAPSASTASTAPVDEEDTGDSVKVSLSDPNEEPQPLKDKRFEREQEVDSEPSSVDSDVPSDYPPPSLPLDRELNDQEIDAIEARLKSKTPSIPPRGKLTLVDTATASAT